MTHQERIVRSQRIGAARRMPKVRLGGRLAAAGTVQERLREWLPENLDAIRALAANAEDERVRLDARKYLIDRSLGKPTERQQVERVPVTFVAPDQSQMSELAHRVLEAGKPRKEPNGEDVDAVRVPAVSEAETQ